MLRKIAYYFSKKKKKKKEKKFWFIRIVGRDLEVMVAIFIHRLPKYNVHNHEMYSFLPSNNYNFLLVSLL